MVTGLNGAVGEVRGKSMWIVLSYPSGRVRQRERVRYSAWPKEAQGRNEDSSGGRGAREQLAEFHKGPLGGT